jgi:hypothetical protein
LGNDSNTGTNELPFATIQRGIDAASSGDTVIVAEGTYVENIQFKGKNIVLTSTDPLDPSVVANTVIDANKLGSVVTFSGTETEACILSGFTIRNGKADSGGGIYGATYPVFTHATIENSTIRGNWAAYGGGLTFCNGTIQNNTITGNSAEGYGGGLHECNGTIQNNTITGNSAAVGGGLSDCGGTIQNNTITDNSGGGLGWCNGTIQNNTISGNSAALFGGGLSYCNGTIQNNTISGNSAGWFGGGLAYCDGTIQNNTIAGNSGGGDGGGLIGCNGTIQNNTISGNWAGWSGGGLAYCDGTIQNNTITGNSAGRDGGGLIGCNGTIQNNTITGNSAAGGGAGLDGCNGTIENNTITGNSAANYGGGLSECGGTVENNTITGNSAQIDGGGLSGCPGTIRNCIIWGNTAPTGLQLYESSIPTYSCIEGWTGDYKKRNISGNPCFAGPDTADFRLLPSSPCIDAGYNDPALPATDIAGMHRITFGGKSLTVDMGAWEYYVNTLSREPGGNAVLTWSSLAGKTYSVLTSSDMLTWQTAADNVPSSGDTTTTWTDTTAPFFSPSVRTRYYRTVEK